MQGSCVANHTTAPQPHLHTCAWLLSLAEESPSTGGAKPCGEPCGGLSLWLAEQSPSALLGLGAKQGGGGGSSCSKGGGAGAEAGGLLLLWGEVGVGYSEE